MPNRGDAKLLQGLVRQARENRLVYVILAECRLILPEAQAPQPDHNVHDRRFPGGSRDRISNCEVLFDVSYTQPFTSYTN